MKRLWLLPCIAVSLMAAGVSGKWTGTVEVDDPSGGGAINTPVHAEFLQKGNGITGKIGREEDSQPDAIQNARLDGKHLTFEVSSAETGGVFKFALTLDGDKLDGVMNGSMDDNPINGKVHLTRQGEQGTP